MSFSKEILLLLFFSSTKEEEEEEKNKVDSQICYFNQKITGMNSCEIHHQNQQLLQRLFVFNAQRSLTSRRSSQFPPLIDE